MIQGAYAIGVLKLHFNIARDANAVIINNALKLGGSTNSRIKSKAVIYNNLQTLRFDNSRNQFRYYTE